MIRVGIRAYAACKVAKALDRLDSEDAMEVCGVMWGRFGMFKRSGLSLLHDFVWSFFGNV